MFKSNGMKLYPNLVKAVVEAIDKIFTHGEKADRLIEQTLKLDTKWGSRDRKFVANAIYDVVRWYRLYKSCLNDEQINSNQFYHLFAVSHILKGFELPAWKEFELIDADKIKETHIKNKHIRKIANSIPDWLDELGLEQFGALVWEQEISCLNKEADVYIRVNTLKVEEKFNLLETLKKEGVEVSKVVHPLFDDIAMTTTFKLEKRQRLQHLASYKNGMFEIQDAASQLVAPFLDVKPGMTVIDACAGAGGKTLHLASLMQNKGKILAMDVEQKKLDELEKRALRAGVKIVKTQLINKHEISKNKNSADRLLLDVPCSGLGVLRRNPDAKWKLNPTFLLEIQKVQAQILIDYSVMLKPGGLMVYATCSILPSENQNQVKNFIQLVGNKYELVAEKSILPTQGFDGFYMALIKKIN
ncbi:MAG TPA: RsmB/NOP family class I SAM-dependent RNA methyltransferase [Bacteroidia bacterium]|nr:RsmB/NOP family class I SAM-dependent RNA methyltransferase [Bacteroidia bacterium]